MDDDASPAYKEGAPGEKGREEQHPSTRIPSHPASPSGRWKLQRGLLASEVS